MQKKLRNEGLLGQNKPLRMRWVMIIMAFLATVLNYLHRLSFNYLTAEGPLRELIPDDAFGYIATSFFIAYCFLTRSQDLLLTSWEPVLVTLSVWPSGQPPDFYMQ